MRGVTPALSARRRPLHRRLVESEEPTASPRRPPETRWSIPRAPRRARERDRVAHVGETGDVGERPLEAEAEAGVRHRAVAAQIAVPAVVILVDAALRHARV